MKTIKVTDEMHDFLTELSKEINGPGSGEPDFTLYEKIIEVLTKHSTVTEDDQLGKKHTLSGLSFSIVAVEIDNFVNNPTKLPAE